MNTPSRDAEHGDGDEAPQHTQKSLFYVEQTSPGKHASREKDKRSLGYAVGPGVVVLLAVSALFYVATFEEGSQERKEIDALFTLGLFLILGLAIVVLVQELYPNLIQGSKTMIGVLLIVPLLAFLVLTDRISSLSGAGVSLTVTNVGETSLQVGKSLLVSTPVDSKSLCFPEAFTAANRTPSQESADRMPPLDVSNQAVNQKDEDLVPPFEEEAVAPIWTEFAPDSAPTALGPINYWKLTLRTCNYDADELKGQLETVIAAGTFRFILIVDTDDRFFAYIPVDNAVQLFDAHADAIVSAINETPADLRMYSGIVFEPLTRQHTTLQALERMQENNLDMVPIRDNDGMVREVVTWDQVLTSTIFEIATTTAD